MGMHHVIFTVLFVTAALCTQCSSGPCCDIETGLFKPQGYKCGKPENECHVAISTCIGFSSTCAYGNAAYGTPCSKGVCHNGNCVPKAQPTSTEKPKEKRAETKPDDTTKVTLTTTSTVRIDNETKELHLKITAELEKAKTLLSSLSVPDEQAKTALDKLKEIIETSLKLQNTENAEKLALASSKIQAQLKIGMTHLQTLQTALCATQTAECEIVTNVTAVLQKAAANVKEQRKDARANASGKNRHEEARRRELQEAEEAHALIKEGLPTLTQAALAAADKLEERQREKLAKLVAERMINERLENERVIDAELKRITKKATAARRGSLRMFEKQEKNDEDAQEIKREAKRILETDKEMKMRYFVGLTKEILNSNRERFLAKNRRKVPNEEKYAEEFAREHEIVRRNEEALVNSGYFGEKYGRVNITLPTFTNDDDSSSSAAPSLKATLFGEDGNTPNIAAIACFAVAGVLVVVAIVAVIVKVARSGSDDKTYKKDDDEDTDAYENF